MLLKSSFCLIYFLPSVFLLSQDIKYPLMLGTGATVQLIIMFFLLF